MKSIKDCLYQKYANLKGNYEIGFGLPNLNVTVCKIMKLHYRLMGLRQTC